MSREAVNLAISFLKVLNGFILSYSLSKSTVSLAELSPLFCSTMLTLRRAKPVLERPELSAFLFSILIRKLFDCGSTNYPLIISCDSSALCISVLFRSTQVCLSVMVDCCRFLEPTFVLLVVMLLS